MVQINFTEAELESFLCSDNNLKKYLNLRFLKRQYKTPVGIIDILAYNPKQKSFVIIELKKDSIDSSAYFQINRYYKYLSFKRDQVDECRMLTRYHRNEPPRKTKLKIQKLLIGKDLSSELHYAVEYWYPDDSTLEDKTCYRLFGFDFDKPIDFSWYNSAQYNITDEWE